jgi:cytochrome c556
MSLSKVAAIALASGVLLVSACAPKAPTPTVNQSMTKVMQPNADIVWGVTSHAFNDKGDGLVASKIPQADWEKMQKAAEDMRDRAQVLADAKHVTAAAADETIMGAYAAPAGATKKTWDAASAQQIQRLIDGNPKLFKDRAQNLANNMDALAKASAAKDIQTVYKVSSNLDEDCDSCHQPFWGTDEPPPFPNK